MNARWFICILGISSAGAIVARTVPWPDMTAVDNQNPHNIQCTIDGTDSKGNVPSLNKAAENELKNRFSPPPSHSTPITIAQLQILPRFSSSHVRPESNEGRFVQIEGYVAEVKPGGEEQCNCQTKTKAFLDTHIDLVAGPDQYQSDGHGRFVVEVTYRIRQLAKMGLVPDHNDIGKSWTTAALKTKLLHRKVRFYGYLFYDTAHNKEAWDVNPSNAGGKNWRQSCWEIHPVYGIEVLTTGAVPKPFGGWKKLVDPVEDPND
jgi:hypothetical protein